MARVALAIGGFNETLQDYAPFVYSYTPADAGVSTYHPVEIDFDAFFALYARLRAVRAYGEIFGAGASGPFDFDMSSYQETYTSHPPPDVSGPADESEIIAKCNQRIRYANFGAAQGITIWLKDCGFNSGTEKFSPMLVIDTASVGVSSFYAPASPGTMVPSGASCTFFGEPVPLFDFAGFPNTGSITIDVPAAGGYWTYDGIWDADTGAQLIFPLPTGF